MENYERITSKSTFHSATFPLARHRQDRNQNQASGLLRHSSSSLTFLIQILLDFILSRAFLGIRHGPTDRLTTKARDNGFRWGIESATVSQLLQSGHFFAPRTGGKKTKLKRLQCNPSDDAMMTTVDDGSVEVSLCLRCWTGSDLRLDWTGN